MLEKSNICPVDLLKDIYQEFFQDNLFRMYQIKINNKALLVIVNFVHNVLNFVLDHDKEDNHQANFD